MRPLRISILDLVADGPHQSMFGRVMNANQASVMPQVVATWCEEMGHHVRYECYTGGEDLNQTIEHDTDVVFITAFTHNALLAYAISALARRKGAVTILGGPHARCYPEDSAQYFDYVLGFTDRALVEQVLHDRAQHRPVGQMLSAAGQPSELPSLRQRWKFVAETLRKAPFFKLVPMIGSMGCPYTCSFCIDATTPYQPLPFSQLEDDLRFVQTQMERPILAWHDPNFGIRFDDYMSVIERSDPARKLRHVAETSLVLLAEPNVKRMAKAGFIGILPGIESWYDYGNKSKAKAVNGLEKVEQVAGHLNMILRHLPFVQANFVLGLDCDAGHEPFALSKRFIDLAPGVYPAYSLYTAYGRAAPANLDLQRSKRVLPIPLAFLDSTKAMNIRPLNYDWAEFYGLSLDLLAHAWSGRAVYRRFMANRGAITRSLNLVRSVTTKRISYHGQVHKLLQSHSPTQDYFAGDYRVLPAFYRDQIPARLGKLFEALPTDAVSHNAYAYLHGAAKVAA